jgi:hypothetical protein
MNPIDLLWAESFPDQATAYALTPFSQAAPMATSGALCFVLTERLIDPARFVAAYHTLGRCCPDPEPMVRVRPVRWNPNSRQVSLLEAPACVLQARSAVDVASAVVYCWRRVSASMSEMSFRADQRRSEAVASPFIWAILLSAKLSPSLSRPLRSARSAADYTPHGIKLSPAPLQKSSTSAHVRYTWQCAPCRF